MTLNANHEPLGAGFCIQGEGEPATAIFVIVDDLPNAEIRPSQPGKGFVVHVDGMAPVHTSVTLDYCYQTAAQWLAVAHAMDTEQQRRNMEAFKDMLEALHNSDLFQPGEDMSEAARKLLKAGVVAPERTGNAHGERTQP